jgi:hypothetical protein
MRKGQFLERQTLVCKCGKEYSVSQKRLESGRGKFCSQECKYKYRVMPKRGKGTYIIIKENPTWIKKGQNLSPKTNFKKGHVPHNFMESGYGYSTIHDWVVLRLGKALKCDQCGKTEGAIEWSNISHEYKRDLSDWRSLCKKCHVAYDRKNGWGEATRKFSLPGRKLKKSS